MEDKRLFLLDAYALIFRAYYAFIRNPRVNSKGFNTSAVFGFTLALMDVLEKQKPSHIAVVFDHKSPNIRKKEFPFYKAHREETPEDIKLAEPWIRKIIHAFNIPLLEAEGYEADDVIGTLAKKAEKEGLEVYMVTPDKDFAQLVSDKIKMLKPAKGGNPPELWGVEEILERFNLSDPLQFIDILGLMGDAADNIPGVKGVGEKTAMKLIGEYGSIENLYEHLDEIKGKLKEKLEVDRDNALISKKLATILLDAPVDLDLHALKHGEMNKEALKEVFSELEFRSLLRKYFEDEMPPTIQSTGQMDLFANAPASEEPVSHKQMEGVDKSYQCVQSDEDIGKLIQQLMSSERWCFDTETSSLDTLTTELVGMAFSLKKDEGFYVPIPSDQAVAKEILQRFKPVFEGSGALKIAHNIKFDMKVLRSHGIELTGPIYDTMIAHYIAEPGMRHKMDVMSENYLGYKPIPIEQLIGKKGPRQKSMRDIPVEEVYEYAAEDADITLQLYSIVDEMVAEKEQQSILHDLELPLAPVLADMEMQGIRIDSEFLHDYSKVLEEEIHFIQKKIYEMAGETFNLNSPRQMGEILFDKLGVEYKGSKTKTGQYSTKEDVLQKIKHEYPIVEHILNYRELAKLKSTYVDALPKLVNTKTGKIHTTFSQTIAATGRLSSINPNLQNIPIRTERGRKIRKAFVPRSDEYTLLSADYSQIELRILAHISGDAGMREAFGRGEDIHAATASKVFQVVLSDVTPEMRRKAKAVNFGLAYGQSAFGLSQSLNISRKEAKEIIDNYFEQFSGIKDYMSGTIEFARVHGYVETIKKRRRYLKDINSKNGIVRSQAERNAINSPIQGSASDLIKIAMINLHDEMNKRQLRSKMLLQVHDELIFDAFIPELEELKQLVNDKMIHAIPDLDIPLVVDMDTGDNWLEAH